MAISFKLASVFVEFSSKGLDKLQKSMKPLRVGMEAIGKAAKSTFVQVGAGVAAGLVAFQAMKAALDGISGLLGAVAGDVEGFGDGFTKVAKANAPFVRSAELFVSTLREWGDRLARLILPSLTQMLNLFTELSAAFGIGKDTAQAWGETVGLWVKYAADTIKGLIGVAKFTWENISEIASTVFGNLGVAFKQVSEYIVETGEWVTDRLADTWQRLVESVKAMFDRMGSHIAVASKKTFNQFLDGVDVVRFKLGLLSKEQGRANYLARQQDNRDSEKQMFGTRNNERSSPNMDPFKELKLDFAKAWKDGLGDFKLPDVIRRGEGEKEGEEQVAEKKSSFNAGLQDLVAQANKVRFSDRDSTEEHTRKTWLAVEENNKLQRKQLEFLSKGQGIQVAFA